MKASIQIALEHARKISGRLRSAQDALGFQRGEQTGESKTTEQLDRWEAETQIGEGVAAALSHAEGVTLELERLVKILGGADEPLEIAKMDLRDAAAHLETVISEIQTLPRAQKMGVSTTVEDAFEKLNAAKSALADLEALIVPDESSR